MSAKLTVELTVSDRSGAALAAELPPVSAPQLAANKLSNLLAGMASGVHRGLLRIGVDDSAGVAATDALTVTAANIAVAEYVEIVTPAGRFRVTCVASGAADGDKTFDEESVDATTASNIAQAINTHPDLLQWVRASAADAVVTLTARRAGTWGNSLVSVDGTTNGVTGEGAFTGGTDPGDQRMRTVTITHASFGAGVAAALAFDVDISDASADDTITITAPDGTEYVLTCVASGAVAADGEFNEGTDDTTGATEIAAAINALAGLTDLVTATVTDTDNVTITANVAGTAGNSISVSDDAENEAFENGGNPSSVLASGADPADTLTIGNVALQWVHVLPDTDYTENQVGISATTATADAANLIAKINAHSKLGRIFSAAAGSAGVAEITYKGRALLGGIVALAEAGNAQAISGADFAPTTTESAVASVTEYPLGG